LGARQSSAGQRRGITALRIPASMRGRGEEPLSLPCSPSRVYPGRRMWIGRRSAAQGWTSTPDGNWDTDIPSIPWWPCPAARPPAGEPRAGKRGHEQDTAQEQKLRAPARHPPPPASAPSTAASACTVARASGRSPALQCARRAAPTGVLWPAAMACARSKVPQAGTRPRPQRTRRHGGGGSRRR